MDGIIFDVDGTLWDSTDTVAESWNTAIRENSSLDLVVDRQILSGLFGKTMDGRSLPRTVSTAFRRRTDPARNLML